MSVNTPYTLESAAGEYAKKGWRVLPCHSITKAGTCSCGKADCDSAGKHPITRRGVRDATTNQAKINEWWSKHPNANIGVATGQASGFIVLDIDPRNSGDANLAMLIDQYGALPETATAETGGGGAHYLFAVPEGKLRGTIRTGIDLKADGGYIIAAPSTHRSGKQYRWREGRGPGEIPIAAMPDWLLKIAVVPAQETNGSAKTRSGVKAPDAAIEAAIEAMRKIRGDDHGDGSRRLFTYCCRCVEADLAVDQAIAAIRRVATERPFPAAWSDADILKRLRDAESTASRGSANETIIRNKTDLGNAERFAAQHGENVRYCHPWKKWLCWDGKRWRPDDSGEVVRLAKRTARSIWTEADRIADSGKRATHCRFAADSEKRARLDAMIALASSEHPIPVSPESLDADPWILNCENGTIDLKNGKLREHRRDDFLTKLAPCEYPTDAGCEPELWLSFLDRIFEGNKELIVFIRRLLGSAIVGEVRDHVLPIFHGVGANGKGTLTETVVDILGDYATGAPADLLMIQPNGNINTAAIADLRGVRFVAASESADGSRLAESLVKHITGGDTIRARRLYENYGQFKPSHMIILSTNHKPSIRGTDHAMWRRLRLVPFSVVIPENEQDGGLKNKLKAEGGMILKWIVQGCLDWQRGGLKAPAEVAAATDEYRTAEDRLAQFFDDCCLVGEPYRGRSRDLYHAYREWCDLNGERPESNKKFGDRLTERGFERHRSTGQWRLGIGLRDQERSPEED